MILQDDQGALKRGDLGVAPFTVRKLLIAMLFLLVTQVVYWIALGVFENAARPGQTALDTEVALYLTDDGLIREDDTPIIVELSRDPAYIFEDPDTEQIGVFAVDFEHGGTDGDLGLFMGFRHLVSEVRLNGEIVRAQTPEDKWGVLMGWHPAVYVLPAELLQVGENQLLIRGSDGFIKVLPPFFIDDVAEITAAYGWANLVSFDLVIAATAVMVLVALLCLLTNWPIEDVSRIRALSMLLGVWTLKNLTYLGFDPFGAWFQSLALNYAVAYALPLAFVLFAMEWTQMFRKQKRIIFTLYGALLTFPVLLIIAPDRGVSRLAWNLEMGLSICAMAVVIALFSARVARVGRSELIQSSLFILCASAILSDALDERFYLVFPFTENLYLNYYVHPAAGLCLGLGICAILAAQATQARMAALTVNETLSRELRLREEEIRSHEKERAVAEERRRIMRDMHDGLGSRLTFLRALATSNAPPVDEIAHGLGEGLEEMRLIVDSLDTAGHHLNVALGAFRDRIEPRLKSAGIELSWCVKDCSHGHNLNAERILHVYRILQEACTNTVRHGNATRVEIGTNTTSEGITIFVADDGQGMPTDSKKLGHGLINMAERAAAIGGDLSVGKSALGGVEIKIQLGTPTTPE